MTKFLRTLMAGVTAISALTVSSVAFAHPEVVSATPMANKKATGHVTKVMLRFDDKLMARLSGATLTMTSMPGMAKQSDMAMKGLKAVVSAKTIMLTSAKQLPTGTYRVDWYAVGDDNHRVTGKYSFSVG